MAKYFVKFPLLHATFRVDRGSKLLRKSLKMALKCVFRTFYFGYESKNLVMSAKMSNFAPVHYLKII